MISNEHVWPNEFQIIDWAYTEKSKALSYSKYLQWVDNGNEGPLRYLSDHRKDLREDLKLFYPEFKSALVFLFSYIPEKKAIEELNSNLKIASYVTGFEGIDYHYWVKDKLTKIATELKEKDSKIEYTYSIDAQPVLERDLAVRSGLGWIGKNSMLINKEHGSYFIIGSLLLNKKLKLEEKDIDIDHCGTCRRCIDACPTNAIFENERTLESSKCISTFTIELFKEETSPKGYENELRVYGCDICQEVCPWNKKPLKKVVAKKSKDTIYDFFSGDIELIVQRLNNLSNREFRKKFKGTPMERTGRIGILKNLKPFIV